MNPTKSEPVIVAQVAAAIVSILSMLVALGVLSVTPEQFGAIEQAIAAVLAIVAPLAAGLWARAQVTPVATAEAQARAAYQAGLRGAKPVMPRQA